MPSKSTTGQRKSRLGRGLASLMSQPVPVTPPLSDPTGIAKTMPETANPPGSVDAGVGSLKYLDLDSITPNPNQPRKDMDQSRLDSLAASIRSAGVIQPIVVRPGKTAGGFELVAGERRWRAARLAGLQAIPAVVRELDDALSAEWALVENLQREDLDPIERAEAFRRLVDEYHLTQSQLAERVGIDRTSISNFLRLLNLDEKTRLDLRAGRLTFGHSRALLGIEEKTARRALAETCMRAEWSVRELERRIEALNKSAVPKVSTRTSKPAHIIELERDLGTEIDLPVRIKLGRRKNAGEVTISFQSLDEFESIVARLKRD